MNWSHQRDEPIYPDTIWSRPINKNGAGKILIVGGSTGTMPNLANSFQQTEQSGIGSIYILVPESLQKVTKHIPEISYAPSTPSGSFARKALSDLIDQSKVVDGVFLAGDMGKNSETNVMLESFFTQYQGLLFVSSKALESFSISSSDLLYREKTVIFMEFGQLQSLGKEVGVTTAFTSTMGLQQFADALNELTKQTKSTLVIVSDLLWISSGNRTIDSSIGKFSEARASVHGLQQPEKLFEAIVSSVF